MVSPQLQVVRIDSRTGSEDLLPMLQELKVPSRLARLEFGDVQIIGRGPEERPVVIGVEIKAPSDLLTSLRENRLQGHQLPGLVLSYEQIYLLIEGFPSADRNGQLLFDGRRVHGKWDYAELIGQLTTFQNKLGVKVDYVRGRTGSARWIEAKWKWWNGKAYEKHRSHLALQRLDPAVDPVTFYTMEEGQKRRLRVAVSLAEGVGWERGLAAARYFHSVREMVNAEVDQWTQVAGFGKKLAERVWAECRRI